MKIINISNRLPVSFIKTEGKLILKKSSGGLVSAVESLEDGQNELHWVGVADFARIDWLQGESLYQGNFKLHPVFIDEQLYKLYYDGFSNSVLWPLFHYFPSFVEYRKDYFDAYLEVNKQIAEQIQFLISPGDIIWVHDYQLMPLVFYLRAIVPHARIGFFLHIPFPSYELIRILPKDCRDTIVNSLLGADIIGFHTYDYVQHFVTTIQMIAGIQHKNFRLQHEGRTIKVGAYPISIDFNKFHTAYEDDQVIKERTKIKELYADKKIIFSVDRLDYTKGIMYRLKGYAHFLETNPDALEKVVFLLIAVPSRGAISRYMERKEMIENRISEINGRFGNYKWTPIVYQYGSVDFEQLMGLYTACDIALISPIRDGMNLVAKEFVAARMDKRGVLLLSDMTGAAKELTDALLFNPLDEVEVSQKISKALVMKAKEQSERMERMQKQISRNDVFKWSRNFISEMEKTGQSTGVPKLLEQIDKVAILDAWHRSGKSLIVLDYDGTLRELELLPDLAVPNDKINNVLINLCNNPKNDVVIISGRKKEDLDEWFKKLPATLIAEHGIFVKVKSWNNLLSIATPWKKDVLEMMERFSENCAGSFVEEKDYSLAWHYRNVENKNGFAQSRELINLLSDYLISTDVNILDGNKVVEVKPLWINKGEALSKIFKFHEFDFIISIGDDQTDEDMFSVVQQYGGISMKVGEGYSRANYLFSSVSQVLLFLSSFK